MTAPSIAERLGAPLWAPMRPLVARLALAAATRIRTGRLTVHLPDGSRRVFGDPGSDLQAELRIHDLDALRRLMLDGEIGGGEGYVDGLWSSPDLVALLSLAAANRHELALGDGWWRVPVHVAHAVAHRRRRNTRSGARRNIVAHYDLGNDFFALWLDESMTYSSALFDRPDQPLADAQLAKYRAIGSLAGLEAGMEVLEIGTGWGGFARYAAGELGCRVTTITISPSQRDLAQRRIEDAGLADRVRVELRDYRDVVGTYDAIVSIEMLEAVGAEYLGTFFRACDRALRPGGRLGVQVITFPHDAYEAQLRGANWIQTHVFPGGVLPSLAAMERALEGTGLLISSVRDIAASYALTLRAWRERFMAQREAVRAMGFDERFVRTWEYYLSISEAGFRTGMTQDLQIGLEKRRGALETGRSFGATTGIDP
jgi:cyclopropane-fatty-acyl-phospholipid synthase